MGNGGGSATDSTSTVQSPISTSPVARFGLAVPSGRGRTVPLTRTTYSRPEVLRRRRRRTAPAPCGRGRRRTRGARHARAGAPTHPQIATCRPVSDARARHRSRCARELLVVDGLRHRHRDFGELASLATCFHEVGARGGWTAARVRSRQRDGPCTVAVRRASSDPTITATARARTIGRLHLRLHRPTVECPVGADARRRSSCVSGERGLAAHDVDDEDVDRRLRRARTHPSASQASRIRSMPAPKPIPGVGGPPICSASPSYRPPPPIAFCAESSDVARELERRAGVVVETSDEPRLDHVLNAKRLETVLAPARSARPTAPRDGRSSRGRCDHLGVLGSLRVEHPQRVDVQRLAGLARRALDSWASR